MIAMPLAAIAQADLVHLTQDCHGPCVVSPRGPPAYQHLVQPPRILALPSQMHACAKCMLVNVCECEHSEAKVKNWQPAY